jgi:hypothetical protein
LPFHQQKTKKFDVDKRKDSKTKNEFYIMLKNRFEILKILESDTKAVFIDETISDLYIETGEMCLGYI